MYKVVYDMSREMFTTSLLVPLTILTMAVSYCGCFVMIFGNYAD